MKKLTLALCAFLSIATFSFGEEKVEQEVFKSDYARLGFSALPNQGAYSIAPTVTYGKRAIVGNRGVDVSASAAFANDSHGGAFSATFPQVLYLQFLEPQKNNKIYFGAGSALSTLVHSSYNFFGLTANGCIGYALEKEQLPIFAQLDISKPMVPIHKHDQKSRRYQTRNDVIFQLSFGLGF